MTPIRLPSSKLLFELRHARLSFKDDFDHSRVRKLMSIAHILNPMPKKYLPSTISCGDVFSQPQDMQKIRLEYILNPIISSPEPELASENGAGDEALNVPVVVVLDSDFMAGVEDGWVVDYAKTMEVNTVELPLQAGNGGDVIENNTPKYKQDVATTPRHPDMHPKMRYLDPVKEEAITARYPTVPAIVLRAWFADNGYDKDVLVGTKQEDGWEEGVFQYNTWFHVMQDMKRDFMDLEKDFHEAEAAGNEEVVAESKEHVKSLLAIAAEVGRHYLQPWDSLGPVGRLGNSLTPAVNEDDKEDKVSSPGRGFRAMSNDDEEVIRSPKGMAEDGNTTAHRTMPNNTVNVTSSPGFRSSKQ
ncbi:hypothetical protein RUND412_005517 [Rhizina undulata]